MITRAKLVEQLREKEIKSHHNCPPLLSIFSPSPSLSSWCCCGDKCICHETELSDVIVAALWSLVFVALVLTSYVALYLKYFSLSFIAICLGILLPVRLKISRHAHVKKRDKRLLLPLSM